jgi:hypothetical protein
MRRLFRLSRLVDVVRKIGWLERQKGTAMTQSVSKRSLLFVAVLAAAASLNACTGYYGSGVDYGFSGYDDLYYDNYYGTVRDGYWSDDGWYYYRDRTSREYRRDDGRHFRRDAADGYRASQMHRGYDNNHVDRRRDDRRSH